MRNWVLVIAALAIAGAAVGVTRAQPEQAGHRRNASVCRPDIKKFCPNAKSDGDITNCLRNHFFQVSPACRDVLGGGKLKLVWHPGIPVNRYGNCPQRASEDNFCVIKGIKKFCCTPGWYCEEKDHKGYCVSVTKLH